VPLAYPAGSVRADLPDDLAMHSVLIVGLHEGTPLRILSRARPELELRSMGAPLDLSGDDEVWILAFDVARWLEGIDLSSATPTPEGEIRIDADTEPELLQRFDDNLRRSLDLFRDRDGDGALSAGEAIDPLASP
jgi:hypothetical protein